MSTAGLLLRWHCPGRLPGRLPGLSSILMGGPIFLIVRRYALGARLKTQQTMNIYKVTAITVGIVVMLLAFYLANYQ